MLPLTGKTMHVNTYCTSLCTASHCHDIISRLMGLRMREMTMMHRLQIHQMQAHNWKIASLLPASLIAINYKFAANKQS